MSSDTTGIITRYLSDLREIRQAETSPVDFKGQPIDPILTKTNRYGDAIPVAPIQMFSSGTDNADVLKKGASGTIRYMGNTYENVPQSDIQSLKNLANGISTINKNVNDMIRLRGEKAYELVSGKDTPIGPSPTFKELRKTEMERRDYALSFNSWVTFLITILLAFWLFTYVFMFLNRKTSIIEFMKKSMTMMILPGAILIFILYGYLFMTDYTFYLPKQGTSQDQL